MARAIVALHDFLVPARLSNEIESLFFSFDSLAGTRKSGSFFFWLMGVGSGVCNRLSTRVYLQLVTYPYRTPKDT